MNIILNIKLRNFENNEQKGDIIEQKGDIIEQKGDIIEQNRYHV